jgi:hypothetical protein
VAGIPVNPVIHERKRRGVIDGLYDAGAYELTVKTRAAASAARLSYFYRNDA